MAQENDNLEPGAFGIMDTMDMAMGNQDLLKDLYAPETATESPEGVTPIIKDATPPAEPAKPDPSKGKVVTPTNDDDDEKTKSQAALTNFLQNSDEDDDFEGDENSKNSSDTKSNSTSATKDDGADEDENAPQGTQFSALAKDLTKLGVFTEDEEGEESVITTPEQFLEKFQNEKKKGAIEMVDNFLNQFGEDYRNAFEAIFVKGADPKEYFGAYNSIVNFAEMDLSNEDNQVRIIKEFMQDQGFDAEDIETEVERLRNYGDLETVATRNHKVLVKKEAQKLQQIEAKAEAELQQKAQIKNQFIGNVQNILQEKVKAKEFDGIPLNPKLASELQDYLLVDKWKTSSGELLSDFDKTILDLKRPENHAMKVKLGLLLKILEKDPTLSTIQKTGVTKQSNQLFGEVARQTSKDKTQSSSKVGSSPWFENL